jgi:hypothetical protein
MTDASLDWLFRIRLVTCIFASHVEHRGLGLSRGAEFVVLLLASGFGLVLFSLGPAFSLVSLSLLSCLFFLTLGEC